MLYEPSRLIPCMFQDSETRVLGEYPSCILELIYIYIYLHVQIQYANTSCSLGTYYTILQKLYFRNTWQVFSHIFPQNSILGLSARNSHLMVAQHHAIFDQGCQVSKGTVPKIAVFFMGLAPDVEPSSHDVCLPFLPQSWKWKMGLESPRGPFLPLPWLWEEG